MGTLKVILKQDVANLGEEGDVKEVKRGYARNFLFPRKFAVDYSVKNRVTLEKQKHIIEKKRLAKKENAAELKAKLEKEKVEIEIAAGEKGRLYGTVTTSQIYDELVKKGYEISKKEIELKEHIKFGGTYKYKIHIYQDVYAEMEFIVIAKQEEKKTDTRKKRRKKSFDENVESVNEAVENAPEAVEATQEASETVEVNDEAPVEETATEE